VGRWAFARGFVQPLVLTISVVLRIAGLPEPSIHKPSDTMPFLFSENVWSLVILNEREGSRAIVVDDVLEWR
jgi:hypothetical protein